VLRFVFVFPFPFDKLDNVTFKKGKLVTFKEDSNEFEENIGCVEPKEIFGLLGINVGIVVERGVDRILLLFLLLLLLENKFEELFEVSILGVVGNGTGVKDMLKDVGNAI